MSHCQQTLISALPAMTAPVPWSLAWCEDGELAPQDRFDLLQSLVQSESLEVAASLVVSVEQLSVTEITALSLGDVTGLCA
jgi:hypothetical protein